jgi:hypothetical protein
MLPIHLSATPFCHRLGTLVTTPLAPLASKPAHVGAELAVVVEHDVAVWIRQRQRLPELLRNPLARGIGCRVELKNAPTVMLDDKETWEHAKCQGQNYKEIEGRHALTVVFEKGQPTLRVLEISGRSGAADSGRLLAPKHRSRVEQFTMDARRAPIWIVGLHAPNQLSDLLADFGPTDVAGTETPE